MARLAAYVQRDARLICLGLPFYSAQSGLSPVDSLIRYIVIHRYRRYYGKTIVIARAPSPINQYSRHFSNATRCQRSTPVRVRFWSNSRWISQPSSLRVCRSFNKQTYQVTTRFFFNLEYRYNLIFLENDRNSVCAVSSRCEQDSPRMSPRFFKETLSRRNRFDRKNLTNVDFFNSVFLFLSRYVSSWNFFQGASINLKRNFKRKRISITFSSGIFFTANLTKVNDRGKQSR